MENVIDLVLAVNPELRNSTSSSSPESLRESKALYDNLYPSRILAGLPKLMEGDEHRAANEAILAVTDIDRITEAML